jgi:hypothetical protein
MTNQQWLQALHLAEPMPDGLRQSRCDCCRRPLAQQPNKQQQQPGSGLHSCHGCGVACYCSAGCAAKDSRSHARHCRCVLGDRDRDSNLSWHRPPS